MQISARWATTSIIGFGKIRNIYHAWRQWFIDSRIGDLSHPLQAAENNKRRRDWFLDNSMFPSRSGFELSDRRQKFVLFKSIKKMLLILFCLPFAAVGVAAALLLTDTPFTFMGIVGVVGLMGMLIRKCKQMALQNNAKMQNSQLSIEAAEHA